MKTDSKTKSHLLRHVKEENIAVTVSPYTGLSAPLDASLVDDETIKFTKELADKILKMDTFEGERIVNPRHVQRLYNDWSTGRFMWEHVCLGLCQCEGKTYRLNGQHTCWLRTNIQNGPDPTVRCVTYKVKDQNALRSLYATFDQGKSRTYGHVIKASLVGMPICANVWPSVICHLGSGLRFWEYGDEKGRTVPASDVVAAIEGKHSALWKRVAIFFQDKYDVYHPIRRRAMIAAMFATFDVAPNKAAEFWSAITDAIGFKSKQDPRWLFRRYCDEHSASKYDSGGFVADERWYCTAVLTWNKWRSGEKPDRIKPTDKRLKAI